VWSGSSHTPQVSRKDKLSSELFIPSADNKSVAKQFADYDKEVAELKRIVTGNYTFTQLSEIV
jgi:hypothetical protein